MINTPDALDAATAAALETRRGKLMRIAEGKGIRVRVAYACAVMVGLFAIAAFLAGDRRAAIILASQFCVVIGFVLLATSAARRKARRELEGMKTPN
jgi:predicted lysophospholipase L1 biosynthesis ABC-type transport system permease subunit